MKYLLEKLFEKKVKRKVKRKKHNMKPEIGKKGCEAIKKRSQKKKMSTADRHEDGEKVFSSRAEKGLYKLKKVSREFQVPYLAGYSRNRETIYIDCDAARGFKDGEQFCEADKYWCIHESVEDAMEATGADYELSHALATLAEERAVEDDGIDLKKYNAFCAAEVKKAGSRKEYTNLPPDLDSKPYVSTPVDTKLLKKMGYLGG